MSLLRACWSTKLSRFRILSVKEVRTVGTNHLHCGKVQAVDDKKLKDNPAQIEWTNFYKFPYIKHARFLNRFKLYQTILTSSIAPASIYMHLNNQITLENCQYLVGIATLACAMLYVMGNVFRKLIGILSINKGGDKVRISHLTFFGNRKDIVIPVNDVIPFSEIVYNPEDLFYKLKRYNTKDELFIILKYGGILDQEVFKQVFGSSK